MYKNLLCTVVCLYGLSAYAQQDDPFADFEQRSDSAYRQFAAEEEQNYNKFKQEAEALWGDFIESSNKTWVQYGGKLRARSRVDFENGKIIIEAITEDTEQEPKARKRIEGALKTLLTETLPGDTEPILAEQVQDKHGKTVKGTSSGAFAKDVANQPTLPAKIIEGKDQKKRTKYTVELPMAPNHIQTRAKRYYGPVAKYAKVYKLEPSLVFAVIHTESYFNPKAGSTAGALGLMQLVPSSGGHDAYRYVYGKNEDPKASYLFVPENNIELGCAYLHMMQNMTFSAANHPLKRRYCAVSAYNTGAGNVSRAFTGTTNVGSAIKKLNTMEPTGVYNYLLNNLPYPETKNYLKLVIGRMQDYEGWGK